MAELRPVRKLKCQNPQRLILLLARSCDRSRRLAARVCAWEQRSETTQKCCKKPGRWNKMLMRLLECLWGRRTKHMCDCTRTCSREGARALLGDLWFYRLTARWPNKKWFPAPSSVCCQFSCPSKLPCPPSSRLDFMKHKTQGQLLMTPDISLSSRMPVIHTETRWPASKVTKLGPLWPQEKLLSLPIPRATNMSDYWKPIGSALWVFLKTRSLKVSHKLYAE